MTITEPVLQAVMRERAPGLAVRLGRREGSHETHVHMEGRVFADGGWVDETPELGEPTVMSMLKSLQDEAIRAFGLTDRLDAIREEVRAEAKRDLADALQAIRHGVADTLAEYGVEPRTIDLVSGAVQRVERERRG